MCILGHVIDRFFLSSSLLENYSSYELTKYSWNFSLDLTSPKKCRLSTVRKTDPSDVRVGATTAFPRSSTTIHIYGVKAPQESCELP